jgi:crotonobetainyl-CoA hydratase
MVKHSTAANQTGDAQSEDAGVKTEMRDGVLLITLDRPKANAINATTSRELYSAFARLQSNPDLRVAVLTGGGERFFSAGWDLKAAAAGEAVDADHGPGGFAGLTEYFELDKPVIAAVNGLAVGGGFELALAADLIVAADHAEFGLPEVRLGIIPDSGGALRLPKKLPTVIATEMLMTARRITAKEAARWGLVNRVTPGAELVDTAIDLAGEIATGAPLALRTVKQVTRSCAALDVYDGYGRMRSLPLYQEMLASSDADEGPHAFAEKRDPHWQGS